MNPLLISNLQSGGIITNYFCSSQCGHCLYGCSPYRAKNYIDEKTTRSNLKKIKDMGCNSVHVGGGESFLNFEGLLNVVRTTYHENVQIEYIETNSSWYKTQQQAIEWLLALKQYNIRTLLISISPFHNEYTPFDKVTGVMEACVKSGISVFPWRYEFYDDITTFDTSITHSLEEYVKLFGEDYIKQIPMRYWIQMGGRALATFKNINAPQPLANIINTNDQCNELADISHFHLDLYGNYVPGLCSGLSIARDDLGKPLDFDKYPIITSLYNNGIGGLVEWAQHRYNFAPAPAYHSKCHLCFDIRKFLTINCKLDSVELQPTEFYHFV